MTERDYVLGTHDEEIERLGLQHRVWLPRAREAWSWAGFGAGQTLLDLGCGPGWATFDLAAIVGSHGRVIGIDRSRRFLDAARSRAAREGVENAAFVELDLDQEPLPATRVDGVWSRWVYAFVREPRALLERAAGALRPGGVLVMHEYADYGAWRLSPERAEFAWFVEQVIASWREHGGEPDIGTSLAGWLATLGMEVVSLRSLSEAARPSDPMWRWSNAFVAVGLDRLVDLGRVDPARADAVRRAFHDSQGSPGAFLLTPTVLEVVARRQ